jgi:hypothetical protein
MHGFPQNEGENEKMCPFIYVKECPKWRAFFNLKL